MPFAQKYQATQTLLLYRANESFGIRIALGKAPGFAAELFEQHTILFLEVFNDVLLMPVHPAGNGDEKELELRGNGLENPSKILAAQPSSWSRLRLLAVHGVEAFVFIPPKNGVFPA